MTYQSPPAPAVPAEPPQPSVATVTWPCDAGALDRAPSAWSAATGQRPSAWSEKGGTVRGRSWLVDWSLTVAPRDGAFVATLEKRIPPAMELWLLVLMNGVVTIPLALAWRRVSERRADRRIDALLRTFVRETTQPRAAYR